MKKLLIIYPILLSLSLLSCGRKLPNEVNYEVSDHEINERHTDLQSILLEQDNPSNYIRDNQSLFLEGDNKDQPKPYVLDFSESNDTGDSADYYQLEISETNTFEKSYKYRSSSKSFNLYNLVNGDYFYKIHSIYGDKTFTSEVKEISVDTPSPRNLFVDGVINCRDLGGWNIGENRVYKQGLIYRTAQFDYDENASNPIKSKPTSSGLETIKGELGIKTDLDLRRKSELGEASSSPLGSDVNYVSTPMYFGGTNIFTNENNIESLKSFFTILADKSNYPIAFHCVRGTDRTGALAYVIGALVGMNEEDLLMDYVFSSLADVNGLVLAFDIMGSNFYVQGIRNSDGDNLSQKAKNYLINNVGVNESTLNSIIDILVD